MSEDNAMSKAFDTKLIIDYDGKHYNFDARLIDQTETEIIYDISDFNAGKLLDIGKIRKTGNVPTFRIMPDNTLQDFKLKKHCINFDFAGNFSYSRFIFIKYDKNN